jgi:hypothetical protein
MLQSQSFPGFKILVQPVSSHKSYKIVHFTNENDIIAQGVYRPNQNRDGWNFLKVEGKREGYCCLV